MQGYIKNGSETVLSRLKAHPTLNTTPKVGATVLLKATTMRPLGPNMRPSFNKETLQRLELKEQEKQIQREVN